MRLAVLEAKRIAKQRWSCVCFVFFLIVGIWLSDLELRQEYDEQYSSVEEYLAAGNEYDGIRLDDAIKMLQKKQDVMMEVQSIIGFYQMGAMDFEEAKELLSEIGYHVTEPEQITYEFLGQRNIGEELVLEEMLLLQQYPEYLENLKYGTSGLSQISFFGQDDYVEQVRQKTMKDYGNLEVSVDTWYQNFAAREFLQNRLMDAMCFLFLVIVVMLLYTEEQEKGYVALVGITARGKSHFYVQKSFTLLGYVCITVFLYKTALLLYYVVRLGVPIWNLPIQSISAFQMCNHHFSVGQTIVYSMLLEVGIFYSLLQAVSVFACFLKKSSYLIGVTSLIVLGAFLGIYGIGINSNLGWIHYFNPITLVDTARILTSYELIRVFDMPISANAIMCIFSAVVLFGAFAVGISKYGRVPKRVRCRRKETAYVLKRDKEQCVKHTLFRNELRKVLFVYRFGIVLLFLVLILLGSFMKSHDMSLSRKESLYQEYMQELNGPLNASKEEYIANERNKFEQLEMLRDELVQEESSVYLLQYIEGMMVKKEAFERVEEQYHRVVQEGEDSVFLYEDGYFYLFGEKEDSKLNIGILAGIFIIALLLPCFVWIEMEKGATDLIRTTKNGRKKLLITQYKVYFIFMFLTFAAIYIGDMICIFRQYGTFGLTQKMANIDITRGVLQDRSVAFGLGIIVLFRIIGLAVCVLIGMAIMYKIRDCLKGIVMCCICFLLPYIVYISGYEFMGLYFLNSFLKGSILFEIMQKGDIGRLLFVLGQAAVGVGIALAILRGETGGNGIRIKRHHVWIRKN